MKFHEAPYGGHFGTQKTACKVLQCGFYWPTLFKDAHILVGKCDKCQRSRGTSWRNEMPRQNILEVECFNVWGIDFMGPFPPSCGQKYILVAVDYVSKWIEAISCAKDDGATVIKFLKSNIFVRFGVLKAIISDQGTLL